MDVSEGTILDNELTTAALAASSSFSVWTGLVRHGPALPNFTTGSTDLRNVHSTERSIVTDLAIRTQTHNGYDKRAAADSIHHRQYRSIPAFFG